MIAPRRHDLVWLDPAALGAGTALRDWAAKERPFVQRAGPAEPGSVLLGWCRPPETGGRRHAFTAPSEAVRHRARPPHLSEAVRAAPRDWLPLIRRLLNLTATCCRDLRVYGSLAWSWLTGLPYLRRESDLDLLIEGWTGRQDFSVLGPLAENLQPRLDGELVLPTGDAVSWRELLRQPREVLLRGLDGPRLARLDGLIGETC